MKSNIYSEKLGSQLKKVNNSNRLVDAGPALEQITHMHTKANTLTGEPVSTASQK